MPASFDRLLQAYGDLVVRIGLDLRGGQRLLIVGPLANGGASLEAAPLVRAVARSAYEAGAELVEAVWGDEALQLVRFAHARRDTFGAYSGWLPKALVEHVEAGHAVLSIYANDPDYLSGQPADLVGALQLATARSVRPFRELLSRNAAPWCVAAAADPGWAAKVFPDAPAAEQMPRLWDAIFRLCRVDSADPVAAWQQHLAELASRRDGLNRARYRALRYRGPGTDLTLGLPDGHVWVAGQSASRQGIRFTPNLPTEEVFSVADRLRVDGTVRATKPLVHGGTVIEDFTLRFEHGRVVDLHARTGEEMLRQLVATDEGAARLGEVALVPHSSPVGQSGLLFYSTLFDENAASHLALGSAYRFTLENGECMTDEEFERAGGNRSAAHADFMIGSGELDVDGVRADGSLEPVMRAGEWTP
ncbi:MAG: aminopeptidase [Acidobacteria bacterium]|nr:aminopeptidase [Acidobacteriota bacterium]